MNLIKKCLIYLPTLYTAVITFGAENLLKISTL